jgi:hypothetical protein
MQLSFNGLLRPKNAAKNLKKAYGAKLSEAQSLIAQLAGYRDWHELERVGQRSNPTPLDQDVSAMERDLRRMYLIERLQELSGRSFMESARGILAAQLLHKNLEDPERHYRVGNGYYVGQTVSYDNGSVGIVIDAKRAIKVLSINGGIALRGREEVSPSAPVVDLQWPARLWAAYGMWTEEDGAVVLFSRDYCPLWRIKNGKVAVADPSERINFTSQEWFWDDTRALERSPDRVSEEAQRLKRFGVTKEPLTKWATLPMLFDSSVQASSDALNKIKAERPWSPLVTV